MFSNELCSVLIETVGDKHRNIIFPLIAGCSGKQYPFVEPCDFEKRIDPSPRADKPLFVKYKERILNVLILSDVIPTVNNNVVETKIDVVVRRYEKRREFALPFKGIALSRSSDYVPS